jgi:predicted methyltransferase
MQALSKKRLINEIRTHPRTLLEKTVQEGDVVVDATVGNGKDTLFLTRLVGAKGRVYGFDIQKEAIEATSLQLAEHDLSERATLFHLGHQNLDEAIPPVHIGLIKAAIFNLGYLPGGDKTIVTRPKTTIQAIRQLLEMMASGGLIVLVIYHGHPKGAVERDYLLRYVQQLDSYL